MGFLFDLASSDIFFPAFMCLSAAVALGFEWLVKNYREKYLPHQGTRARAELLWQIENRMRERRMINVIFLCAGFLWILQAAL